MTMSIFSQNPLLSHVGKPSGTFLAGFAIALVLTSRLALGDDLIDLRVFRPPLSEARKIPTPTVRWWLRQDPEGFCETAPAKDGFSVAKGGCVFWQTGTATCTLVTGRSTTHSVLGHLLLKCMNAGGDA